MKKLLLILLFIVIAGAMVLIGCGPSETPTSTVTPTATVTHTATATTTTTPTPTVSVPPTGTSTAHVPYGTITVAVTDFGTETPDPVIWGTTWAELMFDYLLSFDITGKYVGDVAETWELSADGRTWTFHIRHDIKFHNGDQLTAEDVYFEMERFTSPDSKNAWSNQLRDQKVSMRVVDPYTFEFVTKDPQPQLVDSFCWVSILPKNYIEEVGIDYFRDNPIGSGPWKFVEHVAETSFKAEANTEYWDPDKVPYYQYWEELQVPEEATQVAMLKRGDVDMAFGISTDRVVEMRDQGWETRSVGIAPATVLAIIGSHFENSGPVYDIRVRQALSYAINRQELCDTLYRGTAVPGGRFFLTPGAYGVTDELIAADPYDPALARQLLAEAGYPDRWANPVITCFLSAGPAMDFWQALQGYWDKVGLQVDLKILDVSEVWAYVFLEALQGNESYLGWIWSWTGGAFNGTAYCRNMYTSYGIHQVTVDDAVTALYDKYIVELDPDLARQYYIDWQMAAKELMTSIGIVYTEPMFLVGPNIGEFTFNTHRDAWLASNGLKHPGQ
jgi:peptide/nickel transport system substrate-binding protein